MKNKYMKEFCKRGLIFGGFGPIVAAIVYFILSFVIEGFTVSGGEMLSAVISTYLLAFIHAGASVFNQIDEWSIPKSLLFHFLSLYIAYSTCYIINSWIPFSFVAFLIFTAAFILSYLAIWLTVYICVRSTERRLNKALSAE